MYRSEEEQRTMRLKREQWSKHVERWRDSGLSMKEYAAEVGIPVGTLKHWKYTLEREAQAQRTKKPQTPPGEVTPATPPLPLVEVKVPPPQGGEWFELEWERGVRLRVPAAFETQALRRLLQVLEERS